MKCKGCGGELTYRDGLFVCDFCGSKFFKEELLQDAAGKAPQTVTVKTSPFVVAGGILTAYRGNETVVVIPEGVTAIGPNAFKGNISITKVSFNPGIREIRDSAFEGCTNLAEIDNYPNVAVFGNNAFHLAGLKSVTIGPSVTAIGKACFSEMPELETVNYMPGKHLKLAKTFYKCPKLVNLKEDKLYFFPSMHVTIELLNNPDNKRPTLGDVFQNTPFFHDIVARYMEKIKAGTCPECGAKLQKGLFHIKCKNCGVDYKN